MTQATRDQIPGLIAKGYSRIRIRARLGVEKRQLDGYLRRYGLKPISERAAGHGLAKLYAKMAGRRKTGGKIDSRPIDGIEKHRDDAEGD